MMFSIKTKPITLAALCLVSFGLMLPHIGFYWDEWAKILIARLWGGKSGALVSMISYDLRWEGCLEMRWLSQDMGLLTP
jgi:hypothetical protein